MSDILQKNSQNHYDIGDAVYIADNGYSWGGGDLDTGTFIIKYSVALTEGQKALLKMTDDAPVNFSAISKLPAFRSVLTQTSNMKLLNRRKYQEISGEVVLKPNAQSR